jgi:hypothetical protein
MSHLPERSSLDDPPATPQWVKILVVIALLVVLLVGGLHLTGYSPMGPGSHAPPAENGAIQP